MSIALHDFQGSRKRTFLIDFGDGRNIADLRYNFLIPSRHQQLILGSSSRVLPGTPTPVLNYVPVLRTEYGVLVQYSSTILRLFEKLFSYYRRRFPSYRFYFVPIIRSTAYVASRQLSGLSKQRSFLYEESSTIDIYNIMDTYGCSIVIACACVSRGQTDHWLVGYGRKYTYILINNLSNYTNIEEFNLEYRNLQIFGGSRLSCLGPDPRKDATRSID
jgi:hypothetical protein